MPGTSISLCAQQRESGWFPFSSPKFSKASLVSARLAIVHKDNEDIVGVFAGCNFAGCKARGSDFKSLRSSACLAKKNRPWSAKKRSRIKFFENFACSDKVLTDFESNFSGGLDWRNHSERKARTVLDISFTALWKIMVSNCMKKCTKPHSFKYLRNLRNIANVIYWFAYSQSNFSEVCRTSQVRVNRAKALPLRKYASVWEVCLVQVGNRIELDTVGSRFAPPLTPYRNYEMYFSVARPNSCVRPWKKMTFSYR